MNAASWLDALPAGDRWRARLLRDGPRIATWILVIALAVQAALILTDLAAAGRSGAGAGVRHAPLRSRLLDLAAITNAHLFGAAPALKQEGADAPQTSMPLVLTGIIAGNDPQNGLAILGQNAQTAKVYAVGDGVPGGAKLHSVYNDRVVIDRDGRLESLSLPRQMNAGNAPPPSSAARVTLIRGGQQQDLTLNIAQVAQEAEGLAAAPPPPAGAIGAVPPAADQPPMPMPPMPPPAEVPGGDSSQ